MQIGPSDVQFGPRDRSDSTRSVFSHFGPRSVRSSKKDRSDRGPKWPRTKDFPHYFFTFSYMYTVNSLLLGRENNEHCVSIENKIRHFWSWTELVEMDLKKSILMAQKSKLLHFTALLYYVVKLWETFKITSKKATDACWSISRCILLDYSILEGMLLKCVYTRRDWSNNKIKRI